MRCRIPVPAAAWPARADPTGLRAQLSPNAIIKVAKAQHGLNCRMAGQSRPGTGRPRQAFPVPAETAPFHHPFRCLGK